MEEALISECIIISVERVSKTIWIPRPLLFSLLVIVFS